MKVGDAMETPRNVNPFTPTFGFVPPHVAGREQVLCELTAALDAGLGNPALSSILMGARGTGKTVVLSMLADEAPRHGWVSVNVSAGPGMLEEVLDLTLSNADEFVAADSGRRVTGITLGQLFGIEWEYRGETRATWRTRMTKALERLDTYGIGLLITVDEVRANLDEMLKLVSTYQHFVRERRRVALFMAGLPQQISKLLNSDEASFFRRASMYRLGRVADFEVRAALEKTVVEAGGAFEPGALEELVRQADGYPYMMQLVGYRSWEASPDSLITCDGVERGAAVAREEFEYRILAVTYNGLSEKDRGFLEAMGPDADQGCPSRLSDIAARMGVSSGYASEYRRRLVEQGVIEEVSRGLVAFALPGMHEYVRERAS